MAISSETLAKIPLYADTHGGAVATGGSGGDKPPRQPRRKNDFLVREGTGRENIHDPSNRVEPGQIRSEQTFPESLKSEYKTFLNDYVKNLAKLNRPDPENRGQTLLQTVLSRAEHVHDKKILMHLTDKLFNEQGHIEDIQVNEAKLEQFLESQNGMVITTMLLEYQTQMELFALGYQASLRPAGQRQDMLAPSNTRTGHNQGRLNRIYHDQIVPLWQHWVPITGAAATGAAVGGIAGAVAVGGIGATAGGVAVGVGAAEAAGYGVYRAIESFQADGIWLDITQCRAAWENINGNPAETAYAKAVLGIDARDINAVGGNLMRNPLRVAETLNVEAVERQIRGKLETRRQFYLSLSEHEDEDMSDRLDALPIQYLTNWVNGQQEQTGTRIQQQLQEYFRPNDGGIRDIYGNNYTDIGFNFGNIDTRGNIGRFMAAQRKMILDIFEKDLRIERARNRKDNSLDVLEEKKKAREGEGRVIKARKATAEAEKTALDKDKTALVAEQQKITNYQVKNEALQQARETLRDTLDSLIVVGGPASFNTPADAIAEINDVLTNPAKTIRVGGVPIKSPEQQKTDAQNEYTTENTRITDPAKIPVAPTPLVIPPPPSAKDQNTYNKSLEVYTKSRQAYDAEVDKATAANKKTLADKLEKIKEDERILGTLIADITKQQKAIDKQISDLGEAANETQQVNALTGAMESQHTEITGWGVAGLTSAELLNQPVDELLRRINAAHPAHGWPEAENAQNRMRVIHAKLEARVQQLLNADATRTPAHPVDFATVTGMAITENQLRTFDRNQIMERINAAHAATGAGWPAGENANPARIQIVENALSEAQKRLQYRAGAINERITGTDTLIAQQDEAIKKIDLKAEIAQLDAAVDLLKRQSTILNGETEEVVANVNEYTEVNPIPAADITYTPEEKRAGHPQGYYEIMNVLFAYKDKEDREGYFKTIQRVLPPDKLADVLNRSLQLGLTAPPVVVPPAPGSTTIQNVLTQIRTRITGHTLTELELGNGFIQVINTVRDEAKALL